MFYVIHSLHCFIHTIIFGVIFIKHLKDEKIADEPSIVKKYYNELSLPVATKVTDSQNIFQYTRLK